MNLPKYLKYYDPESSRRLRSCHLDHLSLVSSVTPQISYSYTQESSGGSQYKIFENSFFYRTHLLWNRLPLGLRETDCPHKFKICVTKYLWQESFSEIASEYVDDITPLLTQCHASLPRMKGKSFSFHLDTQISDDAE